ncbi:DUF4352 domain-containing protein [Thermogemmatispora sp.]|uniref:DUF4352 domain-containing protein n=1 Tax=Thermogemmatispora sp. TaxID=1968838 RepID=UPI001D74E8D0|nr:DUF4352 domain-containing protein [Thermogemmatispora sp.]MBX5449565.1 DUF4352 domain-containing protein [Thermogemmatispora sp.]
MQAYPPPPPPSDQVPAGPGAGLPGLPAGGQTPIPGGSPSWPSYSQWTPSDPYAPTVGVSSGIVPVPAQGTPPLPGAVQGAWSGAPTRKAVSTQTSPLRRSITWLWIVALIVVFLTGLGLGDVIGTLTSTSTTANRAPQSTALSGNSSTATGVPISNSAGASQATPAPAATSSSSSSTTSTAGNVHHKVGETVTFNDSWQIRLNSVTTSPGQDFDQPKAGDRYLLIDVTLLNISNNEQEVAASFNFTLRDSEGREIEMTYVSFASPPPSGKVEPQQKIRGTLVYEISQSQQNFVLSFSDLMESGQLFWDIQV